MSAYLEICLLYVELVQLVTGQRRRVLQPVQQSSNRVAVNDKFLTSAPVGACKWLRAYQEVREEEREAKRRQS